MSSGNEYEIDMSDYGNELELIQDSGSIVQSTTVDARRRVEEMLERRRLERAIQDYDFDLD